MNKQANPNRREFLQQTARGVGALNVLPLLAAEEAAAAPDDPAPAGPNAGFDFTRESGALQPERTVASACQFCNCLCRLNFHLKDGRILKVTGESDDPVQAGMRRHDRAIRWQKQAVEGAGESRPDWEIWIDLAHAMARVDRKRPPEYWTANMPAEWKDYGKLWSEFVRHTPAMQGMTQAQLEARSRSQ